MNRWHIVELARCDTPTCERSARYALVYGQLVQGHYCRACATERARELQKSDADRERAFARLTEVRA